MKKILRQAFPFIFTILLISIFATNSHAQSEIGLKGGILNSNVVNRNFNSLFVDFEKMHGVSFGIFYKKDKILGPVGFQTELLYQLKGTNSFRRHHCSTSGDSGYYPYGYNSYENGGHPQYSYGGYGYYNETTVPWNRSSEKYHYFTIPVLFTFSPVKFLDIYAGPEVGYLFAASKDRMITGDLNRFSAGFTAGAALKLGENTKLDFRYSKDFTTLYDMGSTDLKNQSFAITIQQTIFRKQ